MNKICNSSHLTRAIILLSLVFNLVSWSSLYAQQKEHPKDTTLYGTFGTSRVIESAAYLTFDSNHFYLYLGKDGKALDEGTWDRSDDKAILNGKHSAYNLIVKGNSIYLYGGGFTSVTQFDKYDDYPIFTTTGPLPFPETRGGGSAC